MKLLTIQSRKVLNTLLKDNIYCADFYYMPHLKPGEVEAYQLLMRYCHYKTVPIFCSVYNELANFLNTHIVRGCVFIELDVPNEFITLQYSFLWIELLSFLKMGDSDDMHLAKSWKEQKIEASMVKDLNDDIKYSIQAILPFIKPEWLIRAYKYNKDFVTVGLTTICLCEYDVNSRLTKLKEFI